MHEKTHTEVVNAWLERAGKDASTDDLLGLFEKAWGALWRRSVSAVGEIVLESLGERIRAAGVDRYPFLSPLQLNTGEVACTALAGSSSAVEQPRLQEALGFLLVEFLTVIGDLTDQVLTPGLHAELSRLTPGSGMATGAARAS